MGEYAENGGRAGQENVMGKRKARSKEEKGTHGCGRKEAGKEEGSEGEARPGRKENKRGKRSGSEGGRARGA